MATKQRIAVLGGGMGALSAVYALTDPKNPRAADYEVTVYQLGWRLGGKGASGRNLTAEGSARIEEHGLHVLSGLYHNAFSIIRGAYSELNRPASTPLSHWQAAFEPANVAVLMEHHRGRWIPWELRMPRNDELPGEGALFLPTKEYVAMAIELLATRVDELKAGKRVGSSLRASKGMLRALAHSLSAAYGKVRPGLVGLGKGTASLRGAIGKGCGSAALSGMEIALRRYHRKVAEQLDTNDLLRRRWIYMNYAYANLRGIWDDELIERGFRSINHLDYRAWLERHVIDDGGRTVDSPLVRAQYDGCFAYEDGNMDRPLLAAGVAVRTNLLAATAYKGAIYWKMTTGMGDAVFAPLYQCLLKRGVRFRFFHRVEGLHLDASETRIDGISLTEQASVLSGVYEPLVDVGGLACWPNEPHFAQLAQPDGGDSGLLPSVDFENELGPPNGRPVTLRHGRDFDAVVLGISLGALPKICGELAARSPRWKDMFDFVKTVQTQALQLWSDKSASQLGWVNGPSPVLSAFDYAGRQPFHSYADMTHVAATEAWMTGSIPKHIAYFCSPLAESSQDAPAIVEAVARARVCEHARELIDSQLRHLLPKEHLGEHLVGASLIDASGRKGGGLDGQYLRANVQPSQRYVLSLPGSDAYRLDAHDPAEFGNLYLAGDWTNNGWNVGCLEAAATSGLLAARALSGYPLRSAIIGADFS